MLDASTPSRLNRRTLALGALGAIAFGGSIGARRALGQTTKPNIDGDCSRDEGVDLLINWQKVLLGMTREQVNAPLGWQLFTSENTTLVLLVPSDWQAQFGYATEFTQSGAPIYDTRPNSNAALRITRLLNAESTIAYESGIGLLQGVALTSPLQAAPIAIQSLLGENPDIKQICTIETLDPLSPSWVSAHYFKESIIVTSGIVLSDSSTSFPFTSFTHQCFYAPKETFAEAVMEYFIRFLYQQLSAGGSGDPTPTPTPEF